MAEGDQEKAGKRPGKSREAAGKEPSKRPGRGPGGAMSAGGAPQVRGGFRRNSRGDLPLLHHPRTFGGIPAGIPGVRGFSGDFFLQPLEPSKSFSGKSALWEVRERGGAPILPALPPPGSGGWGTREESGRARGVWGGSVTPEKREWVLRKGSSLGAGPGWKRSWFGGWAVGLGRQGSVLEERGWASVLGGQGSCLGSRDLLGEQGFGLEGWGSNSGEQGCSLGSTDVVWGAGMWAPSWSKEPGPHIWDAGIGA